MEIQNKYSTNNLEQTARNLNSGTKRDMPGNIACQLEQEIELTLEQLRKLEEQEPHETQFYSQPKRSMGTELIRRNQYTPQYVNHSAYSYNRQFSYNETQQRSNVMEAKQKRKSIVHEDRIQKLKQKLFSLMEKHKQSSVRKTKKYWTGRITDPIPGLLM